jgi:uncharacterized protein YhaN
LTARTKAHEEQANVQTTLPSALAHIAGGATQESRLADMEKQIRSMRKEQKSQAKLMEDGFETIQAIHEMVKSLKADKEQTELSREGSEVEIASYELVTHRVKPDGGVAEDDMDIN